MTKRKEPETVAPEPALEPVAETPALGVEAATPIPPPASRRRSGLFGALLGGVIAATAGFGLAHFNVFGLMPALPPDLSADVATLKDQMTKLSDTEASIVTLGKTLDGVEARLATVESRPLPEKADLSGLQALEDRLAAIEALPTGDVASTAALAARLARMEAALQAMPSGGDTAALQAELAAALARLSAAEAEATAQTAEAATAAAKAARDLALRALTDAVTSGQPFPDHLAALADPQLDAALGPLADTGAPTLTALRATFPDAAREVLRLSRDLNAEVGWADRLVDFLASQTEARSLTPREGDDADAVLSRAEFALGEGRVEDALAELASLDPAIAAPFAGWSLQADGYLAAIAALAAAGGE